MKLSTRRHGLTSRERPPAAYPCAAKAELRRVARFAGAAVLAALVAGCAAGIVLGDTEDCPRDRSGECVRSQ